MTAAFDLPDPDATRRLGRLLGEAARRGDCLLLVGTLGAGKTSLAQGLAEGLGIDEPATSPTFTLLNEYRGRLSFFHFDLYRLTAGEIANLGFQDYWDEGRGVVAIEWPERLSEAIAPEDHLTLTLSATPEGGRTASATAHGERAERWLSEVRTLAARD
jgi:tRNA threonylcarbamoyladenosine biosynthesis protein TsaE